jgi:hypothetical protein
MRSKTWLQHSRRSWGPVAASLLAPSQSPFGNCAVVSDPFGNSLTLVDMTKGRRTPNLART